MGGKVGPSHLDLPDGSLADPEPHEEGEDGVADDGQRRLKHVGEKAGSKAWGKLESCGCNVFEF